jgi:ribosomal protein L37AE/L43A
MSRINEKLGIKPAGQRAMMQLPDDRALRRRLTAAICPQCGERGARLSRVVAGDFWCSWCGHRWTPAAAQEGIQ